MNRASTLLLVSKLDQSESNILRRLDLKKNGTEGYSEAFIQNLVHDCPAVLPINSVESAFSPVFPICKEMSLRSGSLDNLLMTPRGDLIAVECKLWRNPQAQREVFAQIIDYAKDLQTLGYSEFQDAIRKARRDEKFDLFQHISTLSGEGPPELDEIDFIDAVSRNLRRARCLLVIVGDGISDKVKEKIFTPFFTTKPFGEGTGLGLSISYGIITKGHGGTLTMHSEEHKGTTFTIVLPVNQDSIG